MTDEKFAQSAEWNIDRAQQLRQMTFLLEKKHLHMHLDGTTFCQRRRQFKPTTQIPSLTLDFKP